MIQLKTPYVPEALGYDSSRLDVLNRFFQEQIDGKELYGAAYAIAREGKMFAVGALGKQSYREEDERPLRLDAIFRTYSITKLFTAVSIFQLIEDGLCRLDDPMMSFISEMEKDFPKTTIAQALSHTGGLPVEGELYPSREIVDPWTLIDREFNRGGRDWVSAGLKSGPASAPGTRWEYSNFGYVLLGLLIERLTGVRAEQYIEEKIIVPCGMTDSGFWNTVKKLPDFAGRLFIHNEHFEKALADPNKAPGPWAAVPQTFNGIYSTAPDLVKFGNMLLNGGRLDGRRILGRKAIEKMTAVYVKPDIRSYCWNENGLYRAHGLGPDVGYDDMYFHTPGAYNHEGWGRSRLMMDPREKLTTAYFIPLLDVDTWKPTPVWNPEIIICSGLM